MKGEEKDIGRGARERETGRVGGRNGKAEGKEEGRINEGKG